MTATAPIVPILNVSDYEAQVARAAELLRGDGVVVLPTETVYGAAARVDRPEAVRRLRALPPPTATPGKPLVVHLARREEAERLLGPVGDLGRRMMRKLWPGPVSLIFDVPAERRAEAAAALGVPEGELYDAEAGTITLRCPDDVIFTDVASAAGGPLVMRRAGSGGGSTPEASAQQAQRAAEEWGGLIDLVIDAGPSRFSKPSTLLRVREDGYEVLRSGVYDQRIVERLLRTTVLFVCSGNTCRSPMAEALARRALAGKLGVSEEELEKRGVSVISAGAYAMPGAKATPQAVEALRGKGLDLSKHRSRPLSVELIHQADAVFTMGRSHLQAVLALVPSAAEKAMMLDPSGDIDDPIGGDVALYESLAEQLGGLIERRLSERALP